MSSNYGPLVPEGQYPPFAVVTPDDHSAWIIIAAALGLVCSLIFGALRIVVRLTISPKFKLDDYSLLVATLLTIIQSSIVLGACSRGLGKSVDLLPLEEQNEVQRMYYTSNLFFVLALGMSKMSVVFFLLRLSPVKRHKLAFNLTLGMTAAWTIASFFAVALQCNLQHAWLSVNEDCTATFLRWQVICAFDIMLEVLIVALAVYLVWSLQSSRSSKFLVVGVFSFRLILIVPIAFRISTFDQTGWTTNPLLLEAPFIAWTQSELNYSLISATIPTFQNFLKNLNTQFGGIGNHENAYGYGSGTDSRIRKGTTASYAMSKLRSANHNSTVDEEGDGDHASSSAHANDSEQGVPSGNIETGASNGTLVERSRSDTANGETMSIGSNESRRMMIKKDVTWNIVTENR